MRRGGERMMTPQQKYQRDPNFHALVNVMLAHIRLANFTTSELREAAVLACTIYEEEKPYTAVPPIPGWSVRLEGGGRNDLP